MLQVGTLRCALPLSHAVETLRPLPVQALADCPAFVAGACLIRGEVLPVVELGKLLGMPRSAPQRFVVVYAGPRKIVLAVDAVLGIEPLSESSLGGLPPLLAGAGAEAIAALRALDGQLLLVLQASRMVPEAVFDTLGQPQ
jgi:purine-binding chemotaxis protein CheW